MNNVPFDMYFLYFTLFVSVAPIVGVFAPLFYQQRLVHWPNEPVAVLIVMMALQRC